MSVFSALLNNGPLLVGPLADRGAFDQYASYRPGQVVVDGGVVYLNVAALGAAPALEDAFARRDQQGWGTSDHGEVWQTSAALAADGPPAIRNLVGLVDLSTGTLSDTQLLGPAVLRADAEVLVAVALPLAASGESYALRVALNATEDDVSHADVLLSVSDAGVTGLVLRSHAPSHLDADTASVPGPTITDGQACLLRLRRVGRDYSATLWASGSPEPASPQATLTATGDQPAGHPCVGGQGGTATGPAALTLFRLRALSAADAPAGDADHWVALADALQVPQPL